MPHPSHDLFYTRKDPDAGYKIIFWVFFLLACIGLYSLVS